MFVLGRHRCVDTATGRDIVTTAYDVLRDTVRLATWNLTLGATWKLELAVAGLTQVVREGDDIQVLPGDFMVVVDDDNIVSQKGAPLGHEVVPGTLGENPVDWTNMTALSVQHLVSYDGHFYPFIYFMYCVSYFSIVCCLARITNGP